MNLIASKAGMSILAARVCKMSDELGAKRLRALANTDAMPHELKECVHEFGYTVVFTFMKWGITKPKAIREIVYAVWLGVNGGGGYSQSDGVDGALDALLGKEIINSKALKNFLHAHSKVMVSVEPTRVMLEASMAEVSGHTIVCTKEEKHRRRLRAALRSVI